MLRRGVCLLSFASLALLAACGGTTTPAPAAAGTPAAAAFAPLGNPPFAWPEGQSPARTVVTLSFGWPKDLRAAVSRQYAVSRWINNRPSTGKKAYAFTLAAMPAAEGLRIVLSNLTIETSSATVTDRVRAAYNKSLEELAAVYFPAYIVSPEGKFLHLDDPAQVRADLKALMELSQKTDAAIGPEQAAQQVQQQLTDENLASRASFEWATLVGAWTGVTLNSGAPATVTFQAAGAPKGAAPAPIYAGTARLAGHVPCEAGGVEADCVALEMRVTADPAQLKANARMTIRANGLDAAKLPATTLDSVSNEIFVRVVAEPYGLVPHRAQIVSRTEMMFKLLASLTVPVRVEDELVLTFRYPSP